VGANSLERPRPGAPRAGEVDGEATTPAVDEVGAEEIRKAS
jgi:hypothetical protein